MLALPPGDCPGGDWREPVKIRVSYVVDIPGDVDLSPALDGAHRAADDLVAYLESETGFDGIVVDEPETTVSEYRPEDEDPRHLSDIPARKLRAGDHLMNHDFSEGYYEVLTVKGLDDGGRFVVLVQHADGGTEIRRLNPDHPVNVLRS